MTTVSSATSWPPQKNVLMRLTRQDEMMTRLFQDSSILSEKKKPVGPVRLTQWKAGQGWAFVLWCHLVLYTVKSAAFVIPSSSAYSSTTQSIADRSLGRQWKSDLSWSRMRGNPSNCLHSVSQTNSQNDRDEVMADRYSKSLVENFHQDMKRTLETRSDMFQYKQKMTQTEDGASKSKTGRLGAEEKSLTSYAEYSPWFQGQLNAVSTESDNDQSRILPMALVNRRHRPPIMSQDFDGAEHVHRMLEVLRHRQRATEESYGIVMQAYLQRGRLRWILDTYDDDKHDKTDSEEDDDDDDGDDDEDETDEATIDILYTASSAGRLDDDKEIPNTRKSPLSRGNISNATANRSVVCAADVVHSLWKQLRRDNKENNVSLAHAQSWNTTAACWLASQAVCATPRGDRDYASRAMSFLRSLRKAAQGKLPPEALLHGIHAAAWQQGNLQKGYWAQKADDMLQELVGLINDYDGVTVLAYQNRSFSFHDVRMQAAAWTLEAWSKSNSPGSAQRAQEILNEMIAINSSITTPADQLSHQHLYLNSEAYSNAILAWSKAGKIERAHSLLMETISIYRRGGFPAHCAEPPLIAFNSVISGWSKRRDTEKATRVLRLLQRMQHECESLVPDAVAFNTVLYSLSNSRLDKQQVVEQATAIVRYMEDNYAKNNRIKPNAFTYNALISVLAKRLKKRHGSISSNLDEDDTLPILEDAISKLEKLWIDGDRSAEPTNRPFNMVINAYAKSQDRSSFQKANDLLCRMNHSNLYQPDIVTMTSVMECLSKSSPPRACQEALNLLEEVLHHYNENKRSDLRPNVRIFSTAILTLSQNQGKVEDAQNLLTKLVQLYEETKEEDLRPNAYPYNYLLNTAANSLEKVEKERKVQLFRVACQVYKDLRKSAYTKPDSFTYGFFLKCCNNLLDDNDELREKFVKFAFEECKQNGLLSNEVLTRLYQGSPPELVGELLELGDYKDTNRPRTSLRIVDLPAKWSRNTVRRYN